MTEEQKKIYTYYGIPIRLYDNKIDNNQLNTNIGLIVNSVYSLNTLSKRIIKQHELYSKYKSLPKKIRNKFLKNI